MPKPATAPKPAAKPQAKPQAQTQPTPTQAAAPPSANGQGHKHPELKVLKCWGDTALTAAKAISSDLLHLETEDEVLLRQGQQLCAANPGIGTVNSAEDARKLGVKVDSVPWSFKLDAKEDGESMRVVCWNLTHNRPIDMTVTRGIRQDVLSGNWAGPTTIPGETVNGDTITVGRDGQVVQGQKRLIALWMACREWRRNPEKYPFWKTEPVIESLLVLGISNHPRVVQTIDNTQARSEADVFATTGGAGRVLGKDEALLSPKEKKLANGMLAAATDFTWKRSGMDDRKYKTIRASQDHLDAHQRIYDAVRHIYSINGNRSLSLLNLSPGTCAGALWLMGQGRTKPEGWREAGEPTEKLLDMTLWSKAEQFWTEFALKQGYFKILADRIAALHNVGDDAEGLGGRAVEKFCVIARAWQLWVAGEKITAAALALDYATGSNGQQTILEPPTFGGIDLGPQLAKPDDEPPNGSADEAIKAASAAKHKAEDKAPAKPKLTPGSIKPQSNADKEAAKRAAKAEEDKQKILANRAQRAAQGKPNGAKA